MRILVDAREFTAGRKTGITRVLENLLRALSQDEDLTILLVANSVETVPKDIRKAVQQILPVSGMPVRIVDHVILPLFARRQKADIIFSPYYKIPIFGQTPKIMIVHDIMALYLPNINPVKKILIRESLRLFIKRAHTIVAVSEFTAEQLKKQFPNAGKKLKVIYNDLPEQWFHPVPDDIVHDCAEKYAGGRPFLLYTGNFKPHKNVELLIQAFTVYCQENPEQHNWKLLLAGDDPVNRDRIQRCIADTTVSDRIHLLSNLPDTELHALYKAADWFITLSSYEGFGYPPLEAMASGCPVLSSNCTSLPEVLGTAAVYVPELTEEGIRDALNTLSTMAEDIRQDYIRKGITQAAIFKPGSSAIAFSDLMKSIES